MDRVEIESIRFICPEFTDEFIWREPFERLQSAPVVVGIDEVIKVLFQLVIIAVMVPFDRCFLDRAVHAFNLAIGPWVFDFCQSMINAVLGTDTVKDMNARAFVVGQVGELDTVVRQDDVDPIGRHFEQVAQECRRHHFPDFLHQLDKGELRSAVDGNEQIEFSFFRADFSDINMKIANRVSFEFLLGRFITFRLWPRGRCHDVSDNGAAMSVTDAGSSPADCKDSRQAAAAYGVERPR